MSDIKPSVVDILEKVIDDKIAKALPKNKVTHSAQVSKIDGSGTVWVRLAGSNEDTPIFETSADYKQGDTVSVRIEHGTARIVGNYSQPAVGETGVKNIFNTDIKPEIDVALDESSKNGNIAKKVAQEAASAVAATNQHFWHNDSGAHVTDDEQDAFLEAEADDFPDWQPDPEEPNYKPWYNVLLNSLGQVFRTANKYLAAFTHSAVTFFDGEWNGEGDGSSHVVATFGKDGAQIGNNGYSLELTKQQMALYDESDRPIFDVATLAGHPSIRTITVMVPEGEFAASGAGQDFATGYPYGNDHIYQSFNGASYYVDVPVNFAFHIGGIEILGAPSIIPVTILDDGNYGNYCRYQVDHANSIINIKTGTIVLPGDDPEPIVLTGIVPARKYKGWSLRVDLQYSYNGVLYNSIIGVNGVTEVKATSIEGQIKIENYVRFSYFDNNNLGAIVACDIVAPVNKIIYQNESQFPYLTFGVGNVAEDLSIATGEFTEATGENSQAHNRGTIASSNNQIAIGEYNIEDTNDRYVVIVGNGISELSRRNSFALAKNGEIFTVLKDDGQLDAHRIQRTNFDNTTSQRKYPKSYTLTKSAFVTDVNDNWVSTLEHAIHSNGRSYTRLGCRGYAGIPEDIERTTSVFFDLGVQNDGSAFYSVSHPEKFRNSIDVDQKGYISDSSNGRAIQLQYSGDGRNPTNWYCMWDDYKIVAVPAKLEITSASQISTLGSGVTILDFKYVQSGKTAQLYIGFSFSSAKSARDVVLTLDSGYRPATYSYGSSFVSFLPCELHTDGRIRIGAAAAANTNYYTSFTYILA